MKTDGFWGLQQSGPVRGVAGSRALAQTAMAVVLSAAVASCASTDIRDFSGYDSTRNVSKEQYKELLNREPPAPQPRGA